MAFFKTLTGIFLRGEKKISPPKPTPKQPPKKKVVIDTTLLEETKAKAQEILLEAKNQAFQIKSQADAEIRRLQNEFSQRQAEISRLETQSTKVAAANEAKQQLLTKLERELANEKLELEKQQQKFKQKFQDLAQMSKDDARTIIFDKVQKNLKNEIEQTIKAAQDQATQEAETRAREILIDALKHGATDYVAEYTVSNVKLPNEESKGRIIGKDGRNIRAFEKITGVDIDLDETPGEVRLSSFDPIRREIAKVALTKLLADGRIQPTRIEEYVKKAKADLEKIAFEEGRKLCHQVGVYNLPKELISMIGQFKFHVADGQNLLSRTLEQVKIGVALAQEIGVNADTVRLGCLLHDLGRVMFEEEGNHIDLTIKQLKRFNLPAAVIESVASHHQTDEFPSPEAVIVAIADTITSQRPGAKYENFDEFVKRMKKLEESVKEFEGVSEAFVLQAGRDVRVVVNPDKIDDIGVNKLALDLKQKIREQLTYPGSVSITISRESRASAVAK